MGKGKPAPSPRPTDGGGGKPGKGDPKSPRGGSRGK